MKSLSIFKAPQKTLISISEKQRLEGFLEVAISSNNYGIIKLPSWCSLKKIADSIRNIETCSFFSIFFCGLNKVTE